MNCCRVQTSFVARPHRDGNLSLAEYPIVFPWYCMLWQWQNVCCPTLEGRVADILAKQLLNASLCIIQNCLSFHPLFCDLWTDMWRMWWNIFCKTFWVESCSGDVPVWHASPSKPLKGGAGFTFAMFSYWVGGVTTQNILKIINYCIASKWKYRLMMKYRLINVKYKWIQTFPLKMKGLAPQTILMCTLAAILQQIFTVNPSSKKHFALYYLKQHIYHDN